MNAPATADHRLQPATEGQMHGFLRGLAQLQALPRVYSFYLAYRAQKGLLGVDPENIIGSVGEIETVGDCRYALKVIDTSGTRYRITVEVL